MPPAFEVKHRLDAYSRLIRLYQPTGTWLLLWPCWWALTLAAQGLPSPRLLVLFALGAFVMRSAGCIVNDIVDRKIDDKVERTRQRPLASAELSLTEAVALLATLLLIAFIIALQLNRLSLLLAFASLALVTAYPFMKRITWWPQAFLGLTFNWGALLGWAAVQDKLAYPAFALYAAGLFWTLGYDTIYAHQDTADDALIGVRSTALRLGTKSRFWISWFYAVSWACLLLAGMLTHRGVIFYAGLLLVAVHFFWQVKTVALDNPALCMRAFISNRVAGGVVFAAILCDHVFCCLPIT